MRLKIIALAWLMSLLMLVSSWAVNVHLEHAFVPDKGLMVKAKFPKKVKAKLFLMVSEEDRLIAYPDWYKKFSSKGREYEHTFTVPLKYLKAYTFPKYTYWIQVIGYSKSKPYISYPQPVRVMRIGDRLVEVPIKAYYIAGIYDGKARFVLELSRPLIVKLHVYDDKGELVKTLISQDENGNPYRREEHDFSVALEPGNYYYQFELMYPAVRTPKIPFTVPKDEFTFAMMGDSRKAKAPESLDSYNGVSVRVLKQILAQSLVKGAQAIFFNGDLITGYTPKWEDALEQFNTFKAAAYPIWRRVPIYPMAGNHDLSSPWAPTDKENIVRDPEPPNSAEDHWRSLWHLPENAPTPPEDHPPTKEIIYSFDAGNVHFAVLNPYFGFVGYARWHPGLPPIPSKYWGKLSNFQLRWLEQDLRSARERGIEHIFVFTHLPLLPESTTYAKRGLNRTEEGKKLAEILSKYGVTALVVSHEHLYSRILVTSEVMDGVRTPFWQINTSRVGAPFRKPDPSLPYAKYVYKAAQRNHFVLVKVKGRRAKMIAYDEWGVPFDEAYLR